MNVLSFIFIQNFDKDCKLEQNQISKRHLHFSGKTRDQYELYEEQVSHRPLLTCSLIRVRWKNSLVMCSITSGLFVNPPLKYTVLIPHVSRVKSESWARSWHCICSKDRAKSSSLKPSEKEIGLVCLIIQKKMGLSLNWNVSKSQYYPYIWQNTHLKTFDSKCFG